ncbi:MAG: amidohydrolase family protein [Rhodospirillaceae bacterium]|nr:amidohydrolase family protein [Rhodospirillaceae bacterium]
MSADPTSLLEVRIPGPNPDWLSQINEEILEPDLPIVDPHHHLWDMRGKRYLLDELMEDVNSGHNIVATVFLECAAMYRADGPEHMRPLGETEFVNGIAAMSASGRYGKTKVCAGIVGFADLTMGAAVEDVLAAQVAAGNGRFRGTRYGAGWSESPLINDSHTNPSEHVYLEPTFREGFAKLAKFDLSFEAWLYHTHIGDVSSLADAFPDQRMVLNHFAGPMAIGPYAGKRDEIFVTWQKDIRELAKRPNVYAKLGGLGMVLNGYKFEDQPKPPGSELLADTWRPYFETAIEAFGPDRCMFESNFPVDKVTSSYAVYWNCFKRIASGASAEEKRALFHDTAARFYKLDL